MFVVDEATAEAIRRAYDEGGELSGIVGFRRHFAERRDLGARAAAEQASYLRCACTESGCTWAAALAQWGLPKQKVSLEMTIAGILKHKGFNVTTVTPGMTIAEVAQVLASKRIGAVLVLDAAGQLLGILSERDIVACLAEHGPRTLEMTAARLMTAE